MAWHKRPHYYFRNYGPSAWQSIRKRNWYARRLIQTFGRCEMHDGIDEDIVDKKVRNVLFIIRWKNYVRYPAWIGNWLWRCITYIARAWYIKARKWSVDTFQRLR